MLFRSDYCLTTTEGFLTTESAFSEGFQGHLLLCGRFLGERERRCSWWWRFVHARDVWIRFSHPADWQSRVLPRCGVNRETEYGEAAGR